MMYEIQVKQKKESPAGPWKRLPDHDIKSSETQYPAYLPRRGEMSDNVCVQRYFGGQNSAVKCTARIYYCYNCKNKKLMNDFVPGEGGSDASSAEEVLNRFRNFSLSALSNVQKVSNGNSPGQCAEPHAIADALEHIKHNREIKKRRIRINKIEVDPAVIENPTQSMKNHKRLAKHEMPRCATCQQWITGNKVRKEYIPDNVIYF